MRGRPQDEAPMGYLTVREAAEILGISTSAVRQRIKRGTLPATEDDVTPGLEHRIYIPHEAIDAALEAKSHEQTQPANRYDVNSWSEAVLSRLDEAVEAASVQRNAIEAAVKGQDRHLSERLENVEANQREIQATVSQAVEIMRGQAELERTFQERMMGMFERMIQMLDEETERRVERERRGLPERRSSFLHRIFGG